MSGSVHSLVIKIRVGTRTFRALFKILLQPDFLICTEGGILTMNVWIYRLPDDECLDLVTRTSADPDTCRPGCFACLDNLLILSD